ATREAGSTIPARSRTAAATASWTTTTARASGPVRACAASRRRRRASPAAARRASERRRLVWHALRYSEGRATPPDVGPLFAALEAGLSAWFLAAAAPVQGVAKRADFLFHPLQAHLQAPVLDLHGGQQATKLFELGHWFRYASSSTRQERHYQASLRVDSR